MIEQEKKDTSSIGPQWPPKESSFNRIKGIDNRGVIRNQGQFLDTVNEVRDLLGRYIESNDPNNNIDRLSIRLVVEDQVWSHNLSQIEGLGEVIVPLKGTSATFDSASILYLGTNGATRLSDENDLKRALLNVERAITQKPVTYKEAISRAELQGFSLSILELNNRVTNQSVQEQMANLYRRFGWEREDVLDILNKPLNVIAVATKDNQIVSAGIAEMSTVNFQDGTKLRMAEITEAATDEKFQGKGLYSSVAARLMVELANLSYANKVDGGQIDFAFGECNGNEPGVLKAVKSLGRTFSYEVVQKFNLPFKGYLPQHVPIAGAPRNTPYNDLFPAFITREKILSLSKD